MEIKAVKCIRKTANQLQPGDVIQQGNIFSGFSFTIVTEVNKTKANPRMSFTQVYEHGGASTDYVGKTAIYWVVAN